jgi:hypothetical protein
MNSEALVVGIAAGLVIAGFSGYGVVIWRVVHNRDTYLDGSIIIMSQCSFIVALLLSVLVIFQ